MIGNVWRLTLAAFAASVIALVAVACEVPQAPALRAAAGSQVAEVTPDFRTRLKLDPFYRKHIDLHGLPILSSAKVADAALIEAAYLIRHMLANRPDILKEMVKNRVRFVVMAPTEMTTDVPEQRNMTPKDYWDRRARGLGGRSGPEVSALAGGARRARHVNCRTFRRRGIGPLKFAPADQPDQRHKWPLEHGDYCRPDEGEQRQKIRDEFLAGTQANISEHAEALRPSRLQ